MPEPTNAAGIVIVGASLAGLTTAETLREESYAGPITLIGAETHLPYHRPALSKQARFVPASHRTEATGVGADSGDGDGEIVGLIGWHMPREFREARKNVVLERIPA